MDPGLTDNIFSLTPPDTNTDNIKKIENIQEASSQTGSCLRAGQLRFIQSATQETNSDATLYDHY